MTRCFLVYFALISILYSCYSYSELCPKTILNTSQGEITATGDDLCRTWTIHPPDKSIATLRLNRFIVDNCINAFFNIHNSEINYNACIKTNTSKLLPSFRKFPISITIFTTTNVSLNLEFTIRNDTICPNKDFQCTDKRNCFNYHQICDGKFDCHDHSDEICESCPKQFVPCSSAKPKKCFDPKVQRCDGHYDCPLAEDEFNCTTICVNAIKCQHSIKCFQSNQRCDRVANCNDDSDETNCSCDPLLYFSCHGGGCVEKSLVGDGINDCKDGSDEKNIKAIILLLALLILTSLATVLVCRWCNFRRNINQLIRNPPTFPLPPFRGPGEYSGYQLQFSECDYLHGGEIYEAFLQGRRESRYGRRINNHHIHNVTPRSSTIAINDSAVAALVSLGVPPEFCVGLESTRSKEMEQLESRESTEETDSLRFFSSNFDRMDGGDTRVVNESV